MYICLKGKQLEIPRNNKMLASHIAMQNIFMNAKGMQKYARNHDSGGSQHCSHYIYHTYMHINNALRECV